MGEVIELNKVDGTTVPANFVDQVFYDKDGEKQNV
jgi:sarcosine oxidase subunit alpha